MSLPYNDKNIGNAKELRRNATPEENHLWYAFLRTYKPKFQRQKAIDKYIVDFFCHEAKLVVELDGSQHFTEDGIVKDDFRTHVLELYGLRVIRISNYQLEKHFDDACRFIDYMVHDVPPR